MAIRSLVGAILAASIASALAPGGSAEAQSVADFYKRAGLVLNIGSGAGGGFDAYSRIFALHFARHLGGNPNIVIRNMPGATGLVAMNYLYNSAPRDGSSILASFNTVILNPLYGDPNAKFDPRDAGWIGSLGKATGTCLTWHTSPIRTIEQARKEQVLVGATGDGSNPTTYPKLLNSMLGTKFKIITGYTTPGLRLAVESGEVAGICGVAWETHMASVPDWILGKKVNFLLQLGLTQSSHLPGVPLAVDLIQNPSDRQVFELLGIPQEFGRPILAPPGVPADRLAALQKAFDETVKDGDYLADAEKAKQIIDPLSAGEINDLIHRAYAMPKEVVARTAVYAVSTDN